MTSEYQRKYRKVIKEMGSFLNADEQDSVEVLQSLSRHDIDVSNFDNYNEDDFETNNQSFVNSSSESEGDTESDNSNEENLRNDLADLAVRCKMTHV